MSERVKIQFLARSLVFLAADSAHGEHFFYGGQCLWWAALFLF